MRPGDYLKAINYSKEDLFVEPQADKYYYPFIINRCLSYFIDTILHANQMNQFSQADKKLQFYYLQNAIRKRKRFSKWAKNELGDEFTIVKEYYGYSNSKTKEIMSLLTNEDIEQMRLYLSGGGINP